MKIIKIFTKAEFWMSDVILYPLHMKPCFELNY